MRANRDAQRISSLDGARAVSIFLVMFFHAAGSHPLPLFWRLGQFMFGSLGVRIFFVVSGFLITALLLKEQERTGRISLRNFYLRRVARIFPASYFYLIVVVLLIPTGYVTAQYGSFPSILLYFADFHIAGPKNISLGQFWSLSVEEQFYFFWPATLVFLGGSRALRVCLLLLISAPVFRVLSFYLHWSTEPNFAFENVCDALASGCLLAILRDRLYANWLYGRLVNSVAPIIIAACAFFICGASLPVWFKYVIGIPLLNFGIVMTLDRYMRMPTADIGRFLNWRPVIWIGTISYSLYLWQQFFLFSNIEMSVFVRVALSVIMAIVSFYLVEKPIRRWLNSKWNDASRFQRPRIAADVN